MQIQNRHQQTGRWFTRLQTD